MNAGKVGDKRETEQWLDVERDDPDAFGTVLAGKLADLTGSLVGPGAGIHYNNVSIAYTHLYGFDMEGVGANAALVTRSGNQGSIAELRIPEAASLLRKAYNVVVGPEINWSSIATTTDYASLSQAITTRQALDYFWRHMDFGPSAKAVQFDSMSFGEGALHMPWDVNGGRDIGVDPTDPENPKPLKTGAMRFAGIPTWDIIRDPTAKSYDASNFIIIREWPDKFDVAATVSGEDPERTETVRQAVLTAGSTPPLANAWMPFKWAVNLTNNRIPLYYLYAKQSPSCLAGRQTVFLEDGTVISDGPLDKRYVLGDGSCLLPVVRTASGGYRGTPWPYTKWFATLGADQARDALRRDLLTNATAVSGGVIAVPLSMMDAGAEVAFQSGGPTLLPVPDGADVDKIRPLVLQQSHPEHFKLDGTLANAMQGIMGIDQLTAGNEIGASWSGALAALVTSTTVQNNSQEQASWTDFVQRCGNVALRHIQAMPIPMRIALAGNSRSALVTTTQVSGTDVAGIERVVATIGGALEQTDAGKNEIAGTALKEGWAKTPEDYQMVRDTGRLDGLTEDLSNELLIIKAENEAIGRGEKVPVMLDDDHRLHLRKHKAVTASLSARQDPKVVAAQQAHQDEHFRILRETDPAILQELGQQPLMPAMPPGAPPGPPGGPQDAPKPPQAEQQAKAPSMPTNPVTGQKATQPSGTTPPALAVKPN